MPETKLTCCFIPCDKEAEWESFAGKCLTADNYTHACSDHIGHLMDPHDNNTVYYVGAKSESVAA